MRNIVGVGDAEAVARDELPNQFAFLYRLVDSHDEIATRLRNASPRDQCRHEKNKCAVDPE